MEHETRCIFCQKTWQPKKWENFLSVCGCCVKKTIESFEKQFVYKLLRVEN